MIVEGKTIAISGAGPGLGSEIAAAALRDGANVVLGARTESKLEKTAARLDPSGERVAYCAFDVVDEARCRAFTQTAVDRFGGLDGVVNVAALDTLFGTLESTSADDWTNALQTNVVGSAQVAKAAAPHLKTRGGGSIVLIGSLSMWLPPPNPQIAYASSKGALISAMYHMVHELGPDKIRVNMVIPTWMWGPPVQGYVKWQSKERGVDEQVIIDEITANMPLGEIPKDEDVAEAAIFLCSDRARMITGETIQVNAGEFLRG
jgi:NAD(P)-dependent dehydrogenase (short-subunit alcohol dehydrogenase family)